MNVVVFSPHEDDETLACGGTIVRKTEAGENVYVVFMTDGRNSHKTVFNIFEKPTPEEVKSIRKEEAKNVAKTLGVKKDNIIFLDFEDGELKNNIPKAKELVKIQVINLKPTEIFVPHEYDLHSDHSSTNTIVLSAVKESHLDLDLYEYIIWSNNNDKFQMLLKLPNFIKVDISDIIDLKIRAISMYKSQTTILFPTQPKPILNKTFLSKFYKTKEYFLKYKVKNGQRIISKT